MTELRRASIRNYRSIVKADLKLGKITIVIGPSDVGKSNVIRALRDWCFNASGGSFATHSKTKVVIGVAVGDKHKVVWEKIVTKSGATGAYYLVDAETNERLRFEKIGRSVPVEIVDVTKMREIDLEGSTVGIQFSEQEDLYFLLNPNSWSPSKVSAIIGKITGVEPLLQANKDLIRERSNHKKDLTLLRSSLKKKSEELASLASVDTQVELIDRAQEISETVAVHKVVLEQAVKLVSRIAKARGWLANLSRGIEAAEEVVVHVEDTRIEDLWETLSAAESLFGRVERNEQAIERVEQEVDKAKSRLQRFVEDLREMSRLGQLKCPLCGEEAHADCRSSLEDQVDEIESAL